eukprot:11196398-Karenia_brevis.AAC.1
MPSVDCFVARLRLHHITAVLKSPSSTLRALLSIQLPHGKGKLPWVKFVIEDMRRLRAFHANELEALGDRIDDRSSWVNIIVHRS